MTLCCVSIVRASRPIHHALDKVNINKNLSSCVRLHEFPERRQCVGTASSLASTQLLLATTPCGASSTSSRTFSAIASPNRNRTLNTADAAMRYRHKYQVNKSPLCAHCAQASWRFDSTQTTQTQKARGLTQADTHSSRIHEPIPTIVWEARDREKR